LAEYVYRLSFRKKMVIVFLIAVFLFFLFPSTLLGWFNQKTIQVDIIFRVKSTARVVIQPDKTAVIVANDEITLKAHLHDLEGNEYRSWDVFLSPTDPGYPLGVIRESNVDVDPERPYFVTYTVEPD